MFGHVRRIIILAIILLFCEASGRIQVNLKWPKKSGKFLTPNSAVLEKGYGGRGTEGGKIPRGERGGVLGGIFAKMLNISHFIRSI